MAIGDALVAPTGVQNQMVGQPSRVPGYSQGLGQAPGQMALPPEPMPIGRPTAVVGGPAYFTPQGYNAPPQPTEAFMPTDRMPDPIGQQFMRQMQSPMGQQFQQQYEATQAPIREAEMAQRAEEQAAQDTRFQEMMDRIAELEGQLAQPEPMPEPDPYVPGQTPFPGIQDYLRNLDFSGLPDFLNFDYDDIMRQYNDRMEMGEPEPIESFLFGQGSLPVENSMGMVGTMGGPGYGEYPLGTAGPRVDPSDPNYRLPPEEPVPYRPEGMSDKFAKQLADKGVDLTDPSSYMYMDLRGGAGGGSRGIGEKLMMMPRISMPELPDFNFNTSNIPSVDESVATSFMPGSGMGRIGQGVATDRESLIGKKIFGQTITPESFGSGPMKEGSFLGGVARPDLPTPNISGPFGFIKNSPSIDERPMIPNLGNIKAFLR